MGTEHLQNSLLFPQMVLWVLVSLLPLVVGERPWFREDSEDAVGLVSAVLDEQPFETLPQEEDEMGDGDGHSPWQSLFGEFASGHLGFSVSEFVLAIVILLSCAEDHIVQFSLCAHY